MAMRGFFDLQTPEHLLRKLERDYARLAQVPEDVDAAYNFFATAENMPEWVKGGGRKGKAFTSSSSNTSSSPAATSWRWAQSISPRAS
jgi:hypothetical protein